MNKAFYIIIVIIILFAGMFFFTRNQNSEPGYSNLDDFAKCLADKEIVMYGAVWCKYCKSEKASFGKSFKYVNYVECPENPDLCLSKGIEGFPTWIFPADANNPEGKKLVGEQGLEKLAGESGCELLKK